MLSESMIIKYCLIKHCLCFISDIKFYDLGAPLFIVWSSGISIPSRNCLHTYSSKFSDFSYYNKDGYV